ncbi:hypothetical protein [Thalassoglobus sp.]|uniref:hypothetical protein n=1 Tax=Thalassoglobus sp. TaxID=2795869 RepID=UPI003AA8AF41
MKTLTRLAASLAVCGLSTAAIAQESDEIFKSLDKNGDGILAADEVSESQQRFFERLVRAGDKNEDGKLSLAEYQATLKEDERPAGTPAGPRGERERGARGRFEPGAMFDRFDSNKDGKLTKSEIPEEARGRLGRIFEEAGKEELSKQEFGQALGKMMRSGRPDAAGGRPGNSDFLAQLDKNKDGKLSKDELPEQLRERLSGLFERAGTDEISLEELARMRGQRDGDRPERRAPEKSSSDKERSDVDRPKKEMNRDSDTKGDRPERGSQRPPMRDGEPGDQERRPEGRPRFGGGPDGPGGQPGMGGPRGFAFMRVLDTNEDGKISQSEALRIARLFDELDHNKDGELDGRELMGFSGRPEGGPQERMNRPGDRPEGNRPDGDRPEGRRRSGDRPEEGRRPEGDRPEGDRPEGARRGFNPEAFLDRFDKDKDGAISKEEATGRLSENFERIDANSDGKIDPKELGEMLRSGRPGGEGRPEGGPPRGRRPGSDGDRPGRPEREGDQPNRPQRPESE